MAGDRGRFLLILLPTWIIAISAVVGGFRFYREIPTGEEFKQILNEAITENTEQITTLIMVYGENPRKTWNEVLEKSFKKAEKNNYVVKGVKGYIIAEKWLGNNKLITDMEEKRIKEIVYGEKNKEINDLLGLTLSKLVKEKELKRDIDTANYGTVHLSPFEKIGVLGGYIPKHKL